MQALSTAAPGKVYTIKWMFGLPEVLNIIRNCQIEEGSEIRFKERLEKILAWRRRKKAEAEKAARKAGKARAEEQ